MTTVSLPVYGRRPSEVNIINKDYGVSLTELVIKKVSVGCLMLFSLIVIYEQ